MTQRFTANEFCAKMQHCFSYAKELIRMRLLTWTQAPLISTIMTALQERKMHHPGAFFMSAHQEASSGEVIGRQTVVFKVAEKYGLEPAVEEFRARSAPFREQQR